MRKRMASDRYMPEALNWTGIGVAALSIAVAIAFALIAGYAVTHFRIDGPRPWKGAQPGTPPSIAGNVTLQDNPERDIRAFMSEKRALLEGYAWIDQQRTLARIPIERAMALVAERAAHSKR
jgi:hypothetical protein